MAAVFKILLPVASGSIRNSVAELVDPKMGVSRWNGVAILSRGRDISTSGLTAAILYVRLPVTSGDIRNSAIEFRDPENGG